MKIGSNILCFCLILFCLLCKTELRGQSDSLPQFSLTERNGIVFIGWNNPFSEITQLIIQRSTDSTKFFKSIMSMPDPAAISNGYVDKKEGGAQQYYRIFYVLPGGRYTFTAARKPLHIAEKKTITLPTTDSVRSVPIVQINPLDSVKKKGLIKLIGKKEDQKETNPTLKPDIPDNKPVFEPSAFIFSNEEGNLILLLPEAEKRHYHLHVFKEDGTPVFKMRNIIDRYLLVDRSNFYQSGWFKFELYEGAVLKEKNRFFISPEDK
jgi:hypothetical protein